MTNEIIDKLVMLTKNIMFLFYTKNYSALENISDGKCLNSEEIKDAITQYGRTIIEPPSEAYNLIDIIKIKDSEKYSVNMPMWTKEENRSDLTLEMTIDLAYENEKIEIDGIHVL